MSELDDDIDYGTTDQGFAAFLATRFTFMGAVDTGELMGKGQYGYKKEFQFLIPKDNDVDQLKLDYQLGIPETQVPAIVMFNKLRLIRQSCRKPFNHVNNPRVTKAKS